MGEDPAKCFGKILKWEKLSNSGDILKLRIPSYSRKSISGQNNYLGMVTSQKMNENEMGYRGSKSDFLIESVKEQRVDGSWCRKPLHLRYTLKGFERNYQVKIPSKQLNGARLRWLRYPLAPVFLLERSLLVPPSAGAKRRLRRRKPLWLLF